MPGSYLVASIPEGKLNRANDAGQKGKTGLPDALHDAGLKARLVRSDQAVCRHTGSDTILVPVESSRGEHDDDFTLNEVASGTWELVAGPGTKADTASAVSAGHNVSPDPALRDTAGLITRLSHAEAVSMRAERTHQ